jgi:uncharacterized membrane protein YoaK (UPF0700 family)
MCARPRRRPPARQPGVQASSAALISSDQYAERSASPAVMSFTLSFVAGMVDVTSFVLLNGLFAAHITGNVVVLAADVATHQRLRPTAVLAVVVFIAVTAALTAAVDSSTRAPYQWASSFLWMQFGLLSATAAAAIALDRPARDGLGLQTVVAVLAVAAMACQNALLHLTFKRAASTAVMTGNIVASTVALVGMAMAALHRAPGARPRSRGTRTRLWETERRADHAAWGTLWPLLLGFTSGCVLGASASEAVHRWAWMAPALTGGILAARVSRAGLPLDLRKTA